MIIDIFFQIIKKTSSNDYFTKISGLLDYTPSHFPKIRT